MSAEKKWTNEPEEGNSEPEQSQKGYGVKKIEIMSATFNNNERIFFYSAIFLASFAYNLDTRLRSVYQTQATSSYQSHSLLTTVNILRSVISAAAQPTIARLSDIYGRMELLSFSIIFFVVGTVIESQAYDVQKFAGGAIIYQLGYTGLVLEIGLICADFSLLNWRLLGLFVPLFPSAINSWISGDVASAMGQENWSWGIAMWAIIVPVVFIPMYLIYYYKYWRAQKNGNFDELTKTNNESIKKTVIDLFWKLDIIGIILFIAVMALLLVPLTLAGGIDSQWKKPHIIAPLVVGFCCIPPFLYWESVTSNAIIPFRLLKDRGIWAAMAMGTLITFVYNIQGDYMFTVLTVSVNESVKSATRIISLRGFVSIITGTIFSLFVVRLRRLKPFIVFGSCLWMVAMGLLYHFRGGTGSHSGIVGAMVVLGIGAGLFTHPTEVSLQSCVNHQHMATVSSMYLAFYYIGMACGSAISGALWTQTLPGYLRNELNDPKLTKSAYADPMKFIKLYEWGTPERDAVVIAYRQTQRILLITGTCMSVLFIISSLFLRDRKLDNVQSLQGAEQVEEKPKQLPWWKKIFYVENTSSLQNT